MASSLDPRCAIEGRHHFALPRDRSSARRLRGCGSLFLFEIWPRQYHFLATRQWPTDHRGLGEYEEGRASKGWVRSPLCSSTPLQLQEEDGIVLMLLVAVAAWPDIPQGGPPHVSS